MLYHHLSTRVRSKYHHHQEHHNSLQLHKPRSSPRLAVDLLLQCSLISQKDLFLRWWDRQEPWVLRRTCSQEWAHHREEVLRQWDLLPAWQGVLLVLHLAWDCGLAWVLHLLDLGHDQERQLRARVALWDLHRDSTFLQHPQCSSKCRVHQLISRISQLPQSRKWQISNQ